MGKADLIATVQDVGGVTGKVANEIVTAIFSGILTSVGKGESVRLQGFGTFEPKNRAARTGRNPQTGEAVNIPAKKTMSFRFSKDAEGRLN
jgi:nucleoid DNA-binding protein